MKECGWVNDMTYKMMDLHTVQESSIVNNEHS